MGSGGEGWLFLHRNQVFRFLIKLKTKAFKRLPNIKTAYQVILLHFLICNILCFFFYNLHSLRRRADHITGVRAEDLPPKTSEQCRWAMGPCSGSISVTAKGNPERCLHTQQCEPQGAGCQEARRISVWFLPVRSMDGMSCCNYNSYPIRVKALL